MGIGPAGEGVLVGGGTRGGGKVGERDPGSVKTDDAELVRAAFGARSPSGWEATVSGVTSLRHGWRRSGLRQSGVVSVWKRSNRVLRAHRAAAGDIETTLPTA